MLKPPSDWDEEYILSLPKEDNKFERKGSLKLDLVAGANPDTVLDELAKQLSAFANMGGGQIIYGLTNNGEVDSGGVSTLVKNDTKEWLERLIPGLTEYEIVGFAVHEFGPKTLESKIQPGKAIYVVDVPDSARAPHQSTRDMKYYVRLGSQSLAAPHKMVEDIRNRQRHPSISLGKTKVHLQPLRQEPGTDIYHLDAALSLTLVNNGTLKCTDTFLLLKPEHGKLTAIYDKDIATIVGGTEPGRNLWHLNQPLPPQSEIGFRVGYHFAAQSIYHPNFGRQWMVSIQSEEELRNDFVRLDDLTIEWTIFADSAPVKTGRITMHEIGIMSALSAALRP